MWLEHDLCVFIRTVFLFSPVNGINNGEMCMVRPATDAKNNNNKNNKLFLIHVLLDIFMFYYYYGFIGNDVDPGRLHMQLFCLYIFFLDRFSYIIRYFCKTFIFVTFFHMRIGLLLLYH